MKCKFCEGVVDASSRFCPHCGVACRELRLNDSPSAPVARKKKVKKVKKQRYKLDPRKTLQEMKCMKWHKFTVNFWLFLEFLLMRVGIAIITVIEGALVGIQKYAQLAFILVSCC